MTEISMKIILKTKISYLVVINRQHTSTCFLNMSVLA